MKISTNCSKPLNKVVAKEPHPNYFALIFGIARGETRCFSGVSPRIWQPYDYTFRWVAQRLSDKYNIGTEMHFQLKKSRVYFDDAERDLNISMYSPATILTDCSKVFSVICRNKEVEKGKPLKRVERKASG